MEFYKVTRATITKGFNSDFNPEMETIRNRRLMETFGVNFTSFYNCGITFTAFPVRYVDCS